METAVIRVSSKGQIVIPASWRKRMGIREGEELLVIGEGDVLMLKKVERSMLRKEFLKTVTPLRKKMKRLGIDKSALEEAVRNARKAA
jgi:AbrB family looped-hinge helix DNA binding protein